MKRGELVPRDGLLFSIPKADEVRKQVIEKEGLEQTKKSLENSLSITQHSYEIEQEKTSILTKRNDDLAQRLQESQHMSDWAKFFWFAAGVVGTSAAAWGLSRIK